MTNEPSPRPWRVSDGFLDRYSTGHREIVDAKGEIVAVHVSSADAALIVDAANERDRLLAAMKAIEDLCKVLDRTDLWEAREQWLDDAIYEIREKVRAAIGEAEG